MTLAKTAPGSPALEEYWPDVEGLAHRETVTDESIALSSPKGSFFDYAVVHVITTNTLNRLRELYPQGRFEARRFRPNIIVAVGKGEPDFVENSWVGLSVEIGETLLLVTNPCARCVMTTLPQADLPQDHGILRTAAHSATSPSFRLWDRRCPALEYTRMFYVKAQFGGATICVCNQQLPLREDEAVSANAR
jgi:hypothetical protein